MYHLVVMSFWCDSLIVLTDLAFVINASVVAGTGEHAEDK